MKLFFAALLIVLVACPVLAANRCKVNDPNINARYWGGCKKGLANGRGTAKGRDTYQGGFIAGNKHGKGTYVWAAGDRYEGDFREGRFVDGR